MKYCLALLETISRQIESWREKEQHREGQSLTRELTLHSPENSKPDELIPGLVLLNRRISMFTRTLTAKYVMLNDI